MALTIARIISVRSALALAVAACVLAAGGCSRFVWEGRWFGKRTVQTRPGDDPLVVGTLAMVDLTIHGNGTFDLFEGGCPRAGSVTYGTGHAYLRSLTAYGRPIDLLGSDAQRFKTEVELTAQKDGTVELRDPGSPDPSPVVLKRRLQPTAGSTRTN